MGDDGGEFLRLDVPHEVVHEVPIREAGVVDGKQNLLTHEPSCPHLVAVVVLVLLGCNLSSNEQRNVLVPDSWPELPAVVREQRFVRMVERIPDRAVTVY